MSMPTQEELQKLFEYNHDTGELRWKVKISKKVGVGNVIGFISRDGYVTVGLFYKRFQAHRLIWSLIKGEIPKGLQIDHVDGVRSNNRIENLRLATPGENQRNSLLQVNNTTGYKGVCKDNGKFRSSIKTAYVTKYLGLFNTPEEAARVYDTAALALHGEFAKTNQNLGLLNVV